jgi:putative hydrolase of the HAD superfamily
VARRLKLHVSEHELHELAWLWYQPILKDSHIDAGVRGMLETLRKAGTKLAIVSNTVVPGHCLDRHLEEAGLLEFFPIRIYSSDTRYRKPHPRIFRIALDKVGVKPDRTVFVGDLLQTDIRGARRSGMKTIWKPARHSAHAHSPHPHPGRHKPDVIIRRITQLPEVLPQVGWSPHPHHKAAPVLDSAA